MDTIQVRIRNIGNVDSHIRYQDVIDLFINGRDLRDIIRDVELTFAIKQGDPEMAGKYEGLWPAGTLLDGKHFLGHPIVKAASAGEGKTALLGCVCGVTSCHPLCARITIKDDCVVWDEFENPWFGPEWKKDPCDYSKVKYVFDRLQYEQEFSKKIKEN